ncbi:hypothetical protein DNTS_015947, partial [Danionella cerebrum]
STLAAIMDFYDPQTIGLVVFGGFMVFSAIGIALVSTFSMKETSYEEALAKQRKEQGKSQSSQRLDKKKKGKASEKKNRNKKKEDKPNGKLIESETPPEVSIPSVEPSLEVVTLAPKQEAPAQKSSPATSTQKPASSAVVQKPAPPPAQKSTQASQSQKSAPPPPAERSTPAPTVQLSAATTQQSVPAAPAQKSTSSVPSQKAILDGPKSSSEKKTPSSNPPQRSSHPAPIGKSADAQQVNAMVSPQKSSSSASSQKPVSNPPFKKGTHPVPSQKTSTGAPAEKTTKAQIAAAPAPVQNSSLTDGIPNQIKVPPSQKPAISSVASSPPPEDSPLVPSPKPRRKKKAKAQSTTPEVPAKSVAPLEVVTKKVPIMAVPPVGTSLPAPENHFPVSAEEPKQDAPSKKKAASKRKTETGINLLKYLDKICHPCLILAVAAIPAESPTYLPYKALHSMVRSMEFSEKEAHQLMEILSDKSGIMLDTWQKAAQKGDPLVLLKKQLEERDEQLAAEQEDSAAAKTRLRDLAKELSVEKSKLTSIETRLSSQLSKREQDLIALKARMQGSHQDHLAETQQLNAKIKALQDQLEKGPNAQMARLQQENTILRDALNQATSQMESKQNAELAKLHQDCIRLNKELGEKNEALQAEEQLRKNVEMKASTTEKQLSQLQEKWMSTEKVLQKHLEEVSEELKQTQCSRNNLQTQLEQAQKDSTALTDSQAHVASVEAEIKECTEQLEGLQSQLQQINAEREQELKELNDKSEGLTAELEQAKNRQVSMLRSKAMDTKEKENVISKLEEELNQLKSSISKQEDNTTKVQELLQNIKEKDDQISTLQVDLCQLKEKSCEIKTLENTEMLEKLQNSLKEKESAEVLMAEEMRRFKEECGTKLADSTAKMESLQKSITDKENLVMSLQEEVNKLKEVNESQGKSCESLEDAMKSFQDETREVLHSLFPLVNIEQQQSNWLQNFAVKAQEVLHHMQQCQEPHQSTEMEELRGKLVAAQESQSTLQSECEQYRTVLAETEGMLKTLQKSVEEEERVWRTQIMESEQKLRQALEKVQELEATADSLKTGNEVIHQENLKLLEARLEDSSKSAEEMTHLKQVLAETERQLNVTHMEAQTQREELLQVRQQLSEVAHAGHGVAENGWPDAEECQVQVQLEQTEKKLHGEQALNEQLSAEVEQAHEALKKEIENHQEQMKSTGDAAAMEDVTQLKDCLEKERKMTKDLGQAATKLQQLLRNSQEQLAKEKEKVKTLHDQLHIKEGEGEMKQGTSV